MHRTSAVMCAASYFQFLSHQIQHEGMSSIRRSGYQNRTVFILYAIHVHGLQYAIQTEANIPWLRQHRASLMPYPSNAKAIQLTHFLLHDDPASLFWNNDITQSITDRILNRPSTSRKCVNQPSTRLFHRNTLNNLPITIESLQR